MDLISYFSGINYLAVLVAAVISLALGALWYSPLMFLPLWLEDLNQHKDSSKKMNMMLTHLYVLIAQFLCFTVLAIILKTTTTVAAAVNLSLIVALLLVVAATVKNYVYEGKPSRLFLVNGGYEVISLVIAGLVIGLWR